MPFRPDAVVIHPDVQDQYDAWMAAARAGRQPAAAVWKSFQTCLARVKADAQWGEIIPKSEIPAYFRTRYQLGLLRCVDLASFHRCFYTVFRRTAVFLDLVDHATYDKWFPGRKRV